MKSIQPSDADIIAAQYIAMEDRSCCGRGFESARRGQPRDANPFSEFSWQWEQWEFGWLEYWRHKKGKAP